MPILHLPGEIIPGQFGPIKRERRFCKKFPGAHHVERRDTFRDADNQFDFGIRCFHDRVGRERRGHKNHGSIGARLVGCFLDAC